MPFYASRLKILRAYHHVQELAQCEREYDASDPITFHKEKRDGHFYGVFRLVREPPPRVPSIVGDIVHNLRSALDLLACDLVRMNGKSDKGVHFPFAVDADELEDAIRRWHLDRAAPEVIDLIRQTKPYRAGNEVLRAVHDLDIQDKHQRLIPAVGVLTSEALGTIIKIEAINKIRPFLLEVDATTYRIYDDWHPQRPRRVSSFGKVVFTFERDSPFGDSEMVPMLERVTEDFSRVIDSFELLCFGTIHEAFFPT